MSKLRVTKSFLDELAERDGLLTLDALRSAGISRSVQARLVRDGLLSDLTAGHFVAGDADWTSYAAAGLRIGGEQSALAGASSLACDGIGERQLPICVLVPRTVQPRDRDWVHFWRSDAENRRVLGHLAPRRVAFDDSVIDACRDLDELGAVALVTRVIQERRTTASRLLQVIGCHTRVRHRGVLTPVLRDGAGIESALEFIYLERVQRDHALAPMVRQYVVPETGHRADGAYPDQRVLIHLDGARYHDVAIDRQLDNRHAALGYRSIRLGWGDCWTTPCASASLIAGAAVFRRCRRCPA